MAPPGILWLLPKRQGATLPHPPRRKNPRIGAGWQQASPSDPHQLAYSATRVDSSRRSRRDLPATAVEAERSSWASNAAVTTAARVNVFSKVGPEAVKAESKVDAAADESKLATPTKRAACREMDLSVDTEVKISFPFENNGSSNSNTAGGGGESYITAAASPPRLFRQYNSAFLDMFKAAFFLMLMSLLPFVFVICCVATGCFLQARSNGRIRRCRDFGCVKHFEAWAGRLGAWRLAAAAMGAAGHQSAATVNATYWLRRHRLPNIGQQGTVAPASFVSLLWFWLRGLFRL